MATALISYPAPGSVIPASFEAWGPFSMDAFRKALDPNNTEPEAVELREAILAANNLDPENPAAAALLRLIASKDPPPVSAYLTKFDNMVKVGQSDATPATLVDGNTAWYADLTAAMTTLTASSDTPTHTYRYTVEVYVAGAKTDTSDNLKYLATARAIPHPQSSTSSSSQFAEGERVAPFAAASPGMTAPNPLGFFFTPKPQVVRGVCVATRVNLKTKESSLYGVFPAVAKYGAFEITVPPVRVETGYRIRGECVLLDKDGQVVDIESGQHSNLVYLS